MYVISFIKLNNKKKNQSFEEKELPTFQKNIISFAGRDRFRIIAFNRTDMVNPKQIGWRHQLSLHVIRKHNTGRYTLTAAIAEV